MVTPPLHNRYTMLLALLLACLSTFGQVNQVIWSQGKPLYANPVATIDSITYGQMLSADTLLIVFDRQSIQFVYDTTENPQANQVFYDTIYVTDTILIQPEYTANGKNQVAHTMRFDTNQRTKIQDGYKCCGVPIRPVYDDNTPKQ